MTTPSPRLVLPDAPADQQALLTDGGVACWEEAIEIPTYEPRTPDRFPMFFNNRVYQGSDGRVYPMPFVDRIASEPVNRSWKAIHLENRWVRLVLLPEIGGRIHVGYDKTREYDFFYRNNVIKPALVGLSGPWISGGVEFNWPQHHRPATYLPSQTSIERHDDGSVTVWHSDIDPLQRMRGTHGVRIRPDESTVEVAAKLFNRTDEPQTFLWWANVAAAVHDEYQSFFPTDVRYVADHARRAITSFPRADRPYYGVDYPKLALEHPFADRIDVYTNIPVPTSYMVTDTADEFFGGYDHRAGAGFVHWADRDIAPGKKQWTWGNGEIGRAWDRQLTDRDGPYVELMAGVFTDNQPDFSYLAPGETREFSQFWYPIQDIGVVHQASRVIALSVDVQDGHALIGIGAAKELTAELSIELGGIEIHTEPATVAPGAPHIVDVPVPKAVTRDDLIVRVTGRSGEVLTLRRHDVPDGEPWSATEPPMPVEIDSVDELLLTAQHLLQYRHPTRAAEPYLHRVLELDPQDSRAHLGFAELSYGRGEYETALGHLDMATARITRRNLNPKTGELSYRRGLVFERLRRLAEAERAYAKATWDGNYALAGQLGVARVRLQQGSIASALEAAEAASAVDQRNTTATAYRVIALRRLGDATGAAETLRLARERDPLDPFLASLAADLDTADPRTKLLVAHEFARAGESDAALNWAEQSAAMGPTVFGNTGPQAAYLRALVLDRHGDSAGAAREREGVRDLDQTLAFPAGLDDFDALMAAVSAAEKEGRADTTALGLLGSWLLGARRAEDARVALVGAIAAGATDPVVARNAALAIVNSSGDIELAETYLRRAIDLAGPLPRLVYEWDQLARLRGLDPETRIQNIERSGVEILERDDLTIAFVELLLDAGRPREAKNILETTRFQPFEGGEGRVISAHDRANLAVAAALTAADPAHAADLLDRAAETPENLGEGRHPADPMGQLLVAAGDAHRDAGDLVKAHARWGRARLAGGVLAVAARPARLDDFWVGVAHCRLREFHAAERVWEAMEATADALEVAPPTADYFATSLPKMLLFDVDDVLDRQREVVDLRAAAAQGRRMSRPEKSSERAIEEQHRI